MAASHDLLFWAFAAIQLVGLATCFATRLVEATSAASSCRHLFSATLAILCGATIAAMYCGPTYWIPCGATLSLTAVGATIDFRGQIEPSAF